MLQKIIIRDLNSIENLYKIDIYDTRTRKNTRIQTMRKNIKDDLSSLEFINRHIEIAPDKIKANQDFINEILENLTQSLEALTDEEKTQLKNVKSFIAQA